MLIGNDKQKPDLFPSGPIPSTVYFYFTLSIFFKKNTITFIAYFHFDY